MKLRILPTELIFVEPLCAIMNQIIRTGGTTALEDELSADEFRAYFVDGPHVLCSHTALDGDDPFAFQSLSTYGVDRVGWADVGTYADPGRRQSGAGSALFAATLGCARKRGVSVINAQIRADNTGGLAYYTKTGFSDYAVKKALPLKDGTLVDRICKKFELASTDRA